MTIKKSFLTGSRAYGLPREDSDFDIVVRCDKEDAKLFGWTDESEREYELDDNSWCTKFGSINYILCFTDARFSSWENGTATCQKIKPVTRDIAKAIIISNFKSEPK